MSDIGSSLTLTPEQLAEIAQIEALTPQEFAHLPPQKQAADRQVLAAYDDLIADNVKNGKYAGYFAGAMAFIMLLFVLFHWTRWMFREAGPLKKRGGVAKWPVTLSRYAESLVSYNLLLTVL